MSKKESASVELCELLKQEEHQMSYEVAQSILQEIWDINDFDESEKKILLEMLEDDPYWSSSDWDKYGIHFIDEGKVRDVVFESVQKEKEKRRKEIREGMTELREEVTKLKKIMQNEWRTVNLTDIIEKIFDLEEGIKNLQDERSQMDQRCHNDYKKYLFCRLSSVRERFFDMEGGEEVWIFIDWDSYDHYGNLAFRFPNMTQTYAHISK